MTTADNELRTLRTAIDGLRAELAGLREDLNEPTGEARDLRVKAAQLAKDRAYDQETQRLVELAERR